MTTQSNFGWALILIINVILFIAIELGCRLLVTLAGYAPVLVDKNESEFIFDAQLGYRRPPNEAVFVSPNSQTQSPVGHFNFRAGTDSYGFQIGNDEMASRELTLKSECVYRIFLFGGSTVAGRYLKDSLDLLHNRLKFELSKKLTNSGVSVEVINAGVGGYTSVQEYLLASLRVLKHFRPDHLVFFDGSNDFAYKLEDGPPLSNRHPYQHRFESGIHRSRGGVIDNLHSLLERNLSIYYVMHRLLTRAGKVKQLVGDSPAKPVNPESVMLQVENYLHNLERIRALASDEVEVTTVLQPTLFERENLSTEETTILGRSKFWADGSDYFEAKELYYNQVSKRITELKPRPFAESVSFAGIFDDKPQSLSFFGDEVHYRSAGRVRIIKHLEPLVFDRVMSRLETAPWSACRADRSQP